MAGMVAVVTLLASDMLGSDRLAGIGSACQLPPVWIGNSMAVVHESMGFATRYRLQALAQATVGHIIAAAELGCRPAMVHFQTQQDCFY